MVDSAQNEEQVGAALTGEAVESDQHLLDKQICPGILANSTHLTASSSLHVPHLVSVSKEEWDAIRQRGLAAAAAAPVRLAHEHDGRTIQRATPVRNAAAYAAFNFVANCMRSSHNHHVALDDDGVVGWRGGGGDSGGAGARWLAVDNDRCFVPEDVATHSEVPDTHRERASQWRSLVEDPQIVWPQALVRRVSDLAAMRGSASDALSLCMGDHLGMLPNHKQVLEEIEDRLRDLSLLMLMFAAL